MNRILLALLASFLLFAGPARAAAEPVELVLEDQRQHGFTSPTRAIARLQAAAPTLGPQTPVVVRMRYHAALAWFAISNDDAILVQMSLRQLEQLATDAKCGPCHLYARTRDAQWAIRRKDTARARELFVQIDAMPAPDDAELRFALEYTRAMLADTTGEHARAVEHAVRAGRIAAGNGDPASQVRALNVLALANAGNGDLDQAEAVALEAYAIAERIGFRYMMAYLRGNLGHIYSGKGDLDRQYAALTDALRLVSGEPGLGELELMHRVNLAEHHNQRGQYRQAVEHAQQAIVLARKQDDTLGEAAALNSLAASQLGLGQPQAAVDTLRRAIANSERIDAKTYLTASLHLLAQAYERTGRNEETIATLRRIIEIDAKANEQTRAKAAAEAQQQFAAERKDREIERLSLENAKRQAEVAARTWQQRLWAALAVALALGGALLVQVVRRVRNANRTLQVDNEALARESVHDPLTGAYNRRHCQQLMGQHEAQLRKSEGRDYAAGVGLMVLDIDFFKKINDRYGHGVGDKVLVEVSSRLRTLVRQQDAVVRWGGEEFVLVLPGTPARGLEVLATRVLEAIGDTPVQVGDERISVTVSIGCAVFPLVMALGWEDSLHVADLALYLSKSGGRNRATCVTAVAADADLDVLLRDLAASRVAGDVELQVICGPSIGTDERVDAQAGTADTSATAELA